MGRVEGERSDILRSISLPSRRSTMSCFVSFFFLLSPPFVAIAVSFPTSKVQTSYQLIVLV